MAIARHRVLPGVHLLTLSRDQVIAGIQEQHAPAERFLHNAARITIRVSHRTN